MGTVRSSRRRRRRSRFNNNKPMFNAVQSVVVSALLNRI